MAIADQGILQAGDTVLGRYEVTEALAQGQRRITYLGRDIKLGRPVAISVVRPECLHIDPDGVEREAQILGSIGMHDNIVSVFDVEVGQDVQLVVFEYLSGGTLANYIEKNGPLDLHTLLRLGRQLCRGLSHLHERGLVHRDVAPKNVLLDERGAAHLGDFDSAVRLDGTCQAK